MNLTRNQFIKLSLGTVFSLAMGDKIQAQTNTQIITPPKTIIKNGMPMRLLGSTGEYISLIGLGGWHLKLDSITEDQGIKLIRNAVDNGINFMENAREYHDGLAEERMGKALQNGYREKVMLMTKNCGHTRTKADSMKSLEGSLKALKTDYLDLWLFHEVIYDNDPEWIVNYGGLEAAIEAKKQGKVRFIGFSGHKSPHILLDMLDKFDKWDVVMMPLNVFDAHFRSFEKNVLPVLNQRNIGAVGMKSLMGFMSDMLYKTKIPFQECVKYVLNLPISSLIMGIESMEQLNLNMDIAKNFKPLTEDEIKSILAKSKPFAGDGRFEKYKTMNGFDTVKGKEAHGFPI